MSRQKKQLLKRQTEIETMASIDDLKKLIDLHDLADRLGIKRGKGGKDALYHSPHHDDKTASLSIFVDDPKHGTGWKDWSNDTSGSCVDLVMLVRGGTVSEAMKWLHDAYAIPRDKPVQPDQPPQPKSQLDYIADRCITNKDKAKAYLVGRGISEAAIDAALRAKTLGFNEWTSTAKAEGTVGYGGPSVAFLVRPPKSAQVVAVDVRFVDPALNGDVKTQTHGEKLGQYWTADPRALDRAKRVALVESSINALSVDTCAIPGTVGVSIRGIGNVDEIDFSFLRGKQVLICLDNDQPFADGHARAGQRPGPEAAWKLYERLTALNISAVLVDQALWVEEAGAGEKTGKPINDANDYLQLNGARELAKALDTYEPWLIAGMPGDTTRVGRPRVYLPSHDYAQYWRFRTHLDFTKHITRMDKGEDDEEKPSYADLCGFRIASLSRVSVASSSATMNGDADHSPTVYFAVTVQTPRHGPRLTRKVLMDDQLHNTQQWSKFGPIWKPAEFSRMVNILERTAHLGERTAANFVGLAWRDGQLAVNEGPDCYFTEAEKQCTYHNLTFPSGSPQDARQIIKAYQATFTQNAAAIALTWALGGHLKVMLGFWPHVTLQADKGAGKSTLIKRLERTLAFTMFSGQSLQTEFRLLTSISYTSHPVGWEELSARRQDVIDKAVAMLQESYQYSTTKRGSEMTEYLMCAPVMLAGEDVPVRSLLGKLIRANLSGKKGPMMPDDLPQFPVRQWLQFLAKLNKMEVLAKYAELRDYCLKNSRAGGEDDGAKRMAGNYAAVMLAWRYLCEFAGVEYTEGGFPKDLLAEMNLHISETSSDRSPWVWIMETALSEIDAGNFKHPVKFEMIDGEEYLLLRPAHIMDHLAGSSSLREKWNALPVKTPGVFKRQMIAAGVMLDGGNEIERTIFTRRVRHLSAISIKKMNEFGLSVAWRTENH
jgi:hypothetical protein